MNPDLPVQERVKNSYLKGLKKLLISWEFPATSVRYDAECGTFMLGGKPFLQADVTEYEYSFRWLDQSWAASLEES